MKTLFELDAGPYPYFKQMRAEAPIHFNQQKQIWEIFRYHDIQKVISDPANFSSELFAAIGKPELQTLVTMDPPRHAKFRRLLAVAFTSKIVAAQALNVHQHVNDLIDAIQASGKVDIVKDISFPLPALIIAGMLGLPRSALPQFKGWAIAAVKVAETAMGMGVPAPELLAKVKEMTDYFAEIAEQRRQQPADDLITALVHAQVDGEQLTVEEISNMCKLVTVAGFDTTTIFISNAMHIALQLPDVQTSLAENPFLIDPYLEEVLRFAAPFHTFARVAKHDVEIGGHVIKQGQWVVTHYGSGNRDELAFENPEQFDMHRSPNRHLSFGHGIHFCIGAPLGRLEAKIVMPALLRRLPGLRLDPDIGATRIDSSVQFGFSSLPALFDPIAAAAVT